MKKKTKEDKSIGMIFFKSLTPTEKDVFFSMTEGFSYSETAKNFDISVSTVKKHRENICNKLRDILKGNCTCKKNSRIGFSWFKFALKFELIDGQKWLERVKESPFCRD